MGFEAAFIFTVGLEGGYSNHPLDSGGATMYGITEKVARDNGYLGEMKELPLRVAKNIYKTEYWDRIRLDEIKNEKLQELMFDASVNHGYSRAVLLAQRAYNTLNKDTITEDGIIGTQTIKALNSYHYETVIAFMYLVERGKYFGAIVKNNDSQKAFIRGWTNRMIKLARKVV
jgi:lysozyme family protein